MAGGVNLLTNVIIGGQTTAGFNALAGKIQSLGAQIDRIGSVVRDFEIDSAKVYRNYEDNMLAAEYALSAQYDNVNDLSKVMKSLDEYAQGWAASTIFHTDDVSNAINEAAHAGWDYQKIIAGIPQAMYIAQAGGMDLSAGLDYLIKMMNATETPFEKSGRVIDQWAKASNLSATNIDEMGQAFMSMGAAAQFGDSTQELFTLLAILADVGTTGSKAGTALRSSMMRLIAPTTKAEDAMSLLGADAEEINEVLSDTNVTKAAKKLEGLGFSAYDAEGKLLPMVEIYHNLYDAMDGLDEQSQNEILSAIFPLRTIAAAKAFMAAIGNGKMDRIFQSIGDSEGYAAKGADIMMSGMTGSIETLLSKWEEFKRGFGEMLSPTIEKVADLLGGFVDKLNDLDPEILAGIGSMLTMLAAAGPILLGVGGLMKLVAVLGPIGTMALAGGLGISFLIGRAQKMNELEFKGNFGDLELDLDELGTHVDSLDTKFSNQQATIAKWESALEAAEQQYATSSSRLSETLLMDVLTGKELTDKDKDNIQKYANDLYTSVISGIENSKASDMTLLQALFGDRTTDEEEAVYNTAENVVNAYYGSLYGEAYEIGDTIRKQLTEALRDGSLDELERQAIQDSVDRYNQIMAEIAATKNREEYYKQLYKAQNVSWDSVASYADENQKKQEAELASLDDMYGALWAHAYNAYEEAKLSGAEFVDLNGKKYTVTDESWKAFEKEFYREKAEAEADTINKYGGLTATAFNSLLNGSDISIGWNYLKWMQSSGFDIFSKDFDVWDIVNQESIDTVKALVDSFSSFTNKDIDRIKETLKPFADNEQVAGYIQLLDIMPDLIGAATARVEASERENTRNQKIIGSTQDYIGHLEEELGDWKYREEYWAGEAENRVLNDTEMNAWNLATSKIGEIEGKIAEAKASIEALTGEGSTLTVEPVLDEDAAGKLKNYNFGTGTLKVIPYIIGKAYAEGGRATEPSIFGEAGAEWAIPEEHSEKTAALLNEARQASGFTWGDLISRFGGLNANPSNKKVVVNYSPTINATNAEGVAGVLRQDKANLLKMMKGMLDDLSIREEVEAYA